MAKKNTSNVTTLAVLGIGGLLLYQYFRGKTVKRQLGDCWDVIKGAGDQEGILAVWAGRSGKTMQYNTRDGTDEIKYFRVGDQASLYVSATTCYLSSQAKTLVQGWNNFIWS